MGALIDFSFSIILGIIILENIFEEIIVTKDQLVAMFLEGEIEDSNSGWLYHNSVYVQISALHEKDPKYVFDVTDAQYYKISPIVQK